MNTKEESKIALHVLNIMNIHGAVMALSTMCAKGVVKNREVEYKPRDSSIFSRYTENLLEDRRSFELDINKNYTEDQIFLPYDCLLEIYNAISSSYSIKFLTEDTVKSKLNFIRLIVERYSVDILNTMFIDSDNKKIVREVRWESERMIRKAFMESSNEDITIGRFLPEDPSYKNPSLVSKVYGDIILNLEV